MSMITCLGEPDPESTTLVSGETCAKFYRAWTPSFLRENHPLKIGPVGNGGEAGLTKNLFKNQPRLSNPPPHPNKVS